MPPATGIQVGGRNGRPACSDTLDGSPSDRRASPVGMSARESHPRPDAPSEANAVGVGRGAVGRAKPIDLRWPDVPTERTQSPPVRRDEANSVRSLDV